LSLDTERAGFHPSSAGDEGIGTDRLLLGTDFPYAAGDVPREC
jgi:hypothetical protein